jgi:tetratricopeptide (TPR) repeat protein
MKKIAIVLFLIMPGILTAQKEVKPNVNKAMAALKAGKFDEAKSTIDAATTYEKTMNDWKTWFARGIIYGAMDTTSSYTSTENLTSVSAASFKKAEELAGNPNKILMGDGAGGTLIYETTHTAFKQSYLAKGDKMFAAEDFKGALGQFEKGIEFTKDKPDTTFYEYAGYAAFNAEERGKATEFLRQYGKFGGKRGQPLTMPALIAYEDQKFEESLTYSREVLAIIPGHKDMKVVELNSLIQLQKYDEAASLLTATLKANPNDAQGYYLLGVLNNELKKPEDAKKSFEDALKVDSKHFEAALALARMHYMDAKVIKDEMNALGISAADKKKRYELDTKYVAMLKNVLPYWERAEKLNPNNQDVLDGLYTIYGDLDMQPQLQRIEKRYKELGIE